MCKITPIFVAIIRLWYCELHKANVDTGFPVAMILRLFVVLLALNSVAFAMRADAAQPMLSEPMLSERMMAERDEMTTAEATGPNVFRNLRAQRFLVPSARRSLHRNIQS